MSRREAAREALLYLVFGVLTTAVNFVSFHLFSLLFGEELYLLAHAAAWLVAVIFAFVTNKLFVFKKRNETVAAALREAGEFALARVLSLVIEEVGLLLLVDVLGMKDVSFLRISGEMISKAMLAVIVVAANYVFSKYVIFKREIEKTDTDSE